MSFIAELKRRNVFRMGIAYVVVTWVLLQAIDFTLDIISAPNWVMQVFFLAGVAGLPIVLIFAWVFEMTPEGIKRESEIDRSQSTTRSTGSKLDKRIESARQTNDFYPSGVTAFYTLWLDGVEAALPLLEKSYEEKEGLLAWPEYFYLPELMSNDPAWIAFWQKPGLAELMETRRQYGPYENIGYWQEPSAQ